MIEEVLQTKKVVVCLGTGGVGKTTTAAGLGVMAAQLGKKVLVITIDPSLRLASTLGISKDQEKPTRIEDASFKGELYGTVVNPPAVFDRFLRETVTDIERRDRLMSNRLYIQLKTRLSGSQEFTSLEVLRNAVQSKAYDLVILDTPPAQNAIDFLQAPQKLHALFDGNVTRWFLSPATDTSVLKRMLFGGGGKLFEAMERLTGQVFIRELKDFFNLAQDWQGALAEGMKWMHRMLTGSDAVFVLVTSFDEIKLREATEFLHQVRRLGYTIDGLVVNRVFPYWLDGGLEKVDLSEEMQKLYAKMYQFYALRREQLETFSANQDFKWVCRVTDLAGQVSALADLKVWVQALQTKQD